MEPLNFSFAIIEDGQIRKSQLKIPGVDRQMQVHVPGIVAPNFVLGAPDALTPHGLHPNAAHYVDRHRSLLAVNPADWRRLPVPDDEEWFLLGGHPNYYHFIVNYCARLHYYDGAAQREKKRRFIVADDLPPPYYAYLELLGIERSDLIQVSRSGFVECSRLWASNLPLYFDSSGLKADPEAFGWLRNRVMPAFAGVDGERIFLTRKHSAHRRIQNEDELFQIAEQYGFCRICPEDLSLPDLLRMLSQSRSIVTAYGAGMTNSLFCPGQATVVELAGANAMRKYNGVVLCAVAGQKSVRVLGEELRSELTWPYWDLRVEPRDFEMAISVAVDGSIGS
jgi:hypothetical protein